jgi:hypothetical protein
MQSQKKYYFAKKTIKGKEYIRKRENDKGNGKKKAQW